MLATIKNKPLVIKLKNLIYAGIYLIYDCIAGLVKLNARKKTINKKLLIIRVDEIGDYMLWRNFLQEIANADRFKGYEIYVCGNSSWKSIFNTFDAHFVKDVNWLDKQLFRSNLSYRYAFLKNIYAQYYDIVINATYARDRINDDTIVRAAKANEVYGMVGNVKKGAEFNNGHLYSQLFNYPEKMVFEFERSKKFTEFVTGQASKVKNTSVALTQLPLYANELPDKYFVIFPGARNKDRIWPVENFEQVSNYLYKLTGYTAVVCGANGDIVYTSAFCNTYQNPVINLTSKTSLPEMLTVLQRAKCLISVDTGAVHLAAAVNCPVFGVFNGTYYKRFAPYPKAISAHFFAIYPDEVDADLNNEKIPQNKFEFASDMPYSRVNAQKVIEVIKDNQYIFN